MPIIFDFDGVIADSEIPSSLAVAQALTEAGMPTSLDDVLEHYLGRNWQDSQAAMRRIWGREPPADLGARCHEILSAEGAPPVMPVPGIADFLRSIGARNRAIASSSSPAWIVDHLDQMGLRGHFDDNLIFSATVHVSRGKPHPDIYLHAAQALGVRPETVTVIEDSPTGVAAAFASGARVIGLCAGGHIRPGHDEALRAAGAHTVAWSYEEVSRVITRT